MLAKIDLHVIDPVESPTFQISLAHIMADMVCVVTGQNTYKFMKMEENLRSFKELHSQLRPRGRQVVSQQYTAHCWAKDKIQLVIATATGDMIVCNMSGEFIICIQLNKPSYGMRIDALYPYSRGIIATGQDGYIWPFEASKEEYYRPQQAPICSKDRVKVNEMVIEAGSIASVVLNSTEDMLYFIDRNNQFLKLNIALDGTDVDSTMSEYVHCPFHFEEITGMDICLRKQLVVTCSKSYICIWNYADRKFEICYKCPIGEEAMAVAFHPSGFHILAAVGDKVLMMNVLSHQIKEYHSIVMKNCREIRFSNGGHMFAAGVGSNTYIYNYYTVECPPNLQCKGHSGKINNIDWFDDDSGFADCCNGGLVFFYDLQIQRLELTRCKDEDFKRRNVSILGIANIPGATRRALVASSERKIFETPDH